MGFNTTINDVFKSTSIGNEKSAVGSVLYGINHRQTPNPIPVNKDGHGLVFFTRPQLNLSTANIRAMRRYIPLMTTAETSYPRMVRNMLDPRLNLPCPIMDNKFAFIPLLTNHALSISGFPDPFVEIHTSKPGVYKEVFSMVDSTIEMYSAYDVSTSFRNMIGDPINMMFDIWIHYMAAVFRGDLAPYPDFIAYNEVDYNTRIWRLVLDRNKRFVQKIACTGASIPKSDQLGGSFNYEHDHPINATNDQISIQMHSMGFCYQDPILISEFNKTVAIFNPDMADNGTANSPYLTNMVALKQSELSIFNNRGYPRINEDTMELVWYISSQEYSATMTAYIRNNNALADTITILPNEENID